MKQAEVLDRLKNDEDYYGKFGKKYLSNSDIKTLLTEPENFGKPVAKTPAMLVGGYLHTCILEPDKLHRFKIVETTSRNTNKYKEITGGEMQLLRSEVDMAERLRDKLFENELCRDLILGSHKDSNIEYEVPSVKEIMGNMWKGKADVLNHDERLIIDIKTTSNIDRFRFSTDTYNYDSQAYIYSSYFKKDMIFIAVDKQTHKIGIFDCSPEFLERGKQKVEKAVEQYRLFYKNKDFDPAQYLITKTL